MLRVLLRIKVGRVGSAAVLNRRRTARAAGARSTEYFFRCVIMSEMPNQ